MPKHYARRDSPSPQRRSNWSNSDRRSRLPADWDKRRRRVLKRDQHLCQWRLSDDATDICGQHATDVDHIRPGDNHADDNLRSLCGPHHRQKSSSEGAAAAKAKRRQIAKKYVRTEEHPGLIA